MSKTVSDKQLADDVEKLLKEKGVDEDVVTEVVAKINDTDENTDVDGDQLEDEDIQKENADKEVPEEEKNEGEDSEDGEENTEKDVEEEDTDDGEDTDGETDEDDENADDSDEEVDEEVTEEETDEENDDEVEEGEEEAEAEEVDEESEEDSEEESEEDDDEEDSDDDDVDDEEINPLDKLKDPVFREGFDLGYKFRFEMEKLEKMEVDTEKQEVGDADEEKEDKEEKSIIAQDSIDTLKEQITAEVTASFRNRMEACELVKPLVGKLADVMAFDSANDIYKFALQQKGVKTEDYSADSYRGMIDVMLQRQDNVKFVVGDATPKGVFSETINGAFARLKNIAD